MRLSLAFVTVCLTSLLATPLRAEGSGVAVRAENGLDVILLLDRSSSYRGNPEERRQEIEEFTRELVSESYAFARSHQLGLQLSAANFGGSVGKRVSLSPAAKLGPGVLPTLPEREEIPFRDFRAPLDFALRQVKLLSKPNAVRVVFVVTDGDPWLSSAPMSRSQQETYFWGWGSKESPSLRNYLQDLKDKRASVIVVAFSGKNTLESFWRSVLPQDQYVSALDKPMAISLVKKGLEYAYLQREGPPSRGSAANTLTERTHRSDSGKRGSQWSFEVLRPQYLVAVSVLALAGMLLVFTRALRTTGVERARRRAMKLATLGKKNLALETLAEELRKADEEAVEKNAVAANQKDIRRRKLRDLIETSLSLDPSRAPVEQAEFLANQLSESASLERVEATGLLLLERWLEQRSSFDLEFFQLSSAPKWKTLLEFFLDLQPEQHWSRERREFLDPLQRLAEECLRLRLASTIWKERPEEYLRRYRLNLVEAMGGEQANSEAFDIYDLLEDLLLQRPLHRPYNREILESTSLAHLRPFLAAVLPLLSAQLCLSDDRQELDRLIDATRAPSWSAFPEAEFLRIAAERQREELSHVTPLRELLRVALSPSLAYSSLEPEITTEENGALVSVATLSLMNTERIPAWSPMLLAETVGAQGSLEVLDWPREGRGWRFPVCEKVGGGEAQLVKLRLRYTGSVKLTLTAEYRRTIPASELERSNTILLPLADLRYTDVERSGSSTSCNPYYPDLPLSTRAQWESIASSGHRAIAGQILADEELSRGRAGVVMGLRKTGKTSLLLELARAMEAGKDYLPVYIDIYRWYSSLTENETPIVLDDQDLYYEIAESAVHSAREAAKRLGSLDLEAIEKCLSEEVTERTGKLKMVPEALGRTLCCLERCVLRKVVIILDELDWWLNQKPFAGKAQEILRPLVSLATRAKYFSLLLAHDWVSPEWSRLFRDDELTIIPRRLFFIKRSELAELLSLSGLVYSPSAEEFLWRVTGGWSGVIDLLAFTVTEKVLQDGVEGKSVVDLATVRSVVKYLVEAPEFARFFEAYRRGLSADERHLIAWLSRLGLVDEETGLIRYLRFTARMGFEFELPRTGDIGGRSLAEVLDVFVSLTQKEIIEVVDGAFGLCRLRTGFLAYTSQQGEVEDPFKLNDT